ncbi:cytochrome c biogenesis protein ResB [Actinacidiphila oryziradicis]|uniref:Cytochrome c biogenesis protein ResB n=1 Tax=Actinacidiphila oryziradicis TaxID=2571141 RepID=A0A4U0SSQ7_9ACTN|nr:cytochrome c biogenesis protein ResB [Actinacidiphila oryziradicis]TKA13082.1 cytochrome c biogenesis protein ResB [Actinacidiphila oryziradicis]
MSSTTDTPPGATEERDLGAAGAQLSTAPAEETAQPVPGSFGGVRAPGRRGAVAWWGREITGWLRWMWRQLTSMRVALFLLFLLSLAAIPGSLIPQTSVDRVKVADWQKAHSSITPLYERLGLFHVYSSPWFSAIYILLFTSLAGCIVPRSWQFVGQLRSKPPAAPRNLTRLPAYATWRTDAAPEKVLQSAQRVLRGRRFRTQIVGTAVASEKGFLREAGNLLFHIALFGLLVSFGVGQLWKAEGGKLIVEGDGFSNTLTQYDDFSPGTFYGAKDLNPFGFTLDGFTASYARSGSDKGTPRTFRANIHYWNGTNGTEHKSSIEVNKPLDIEGSKVYLIGHGYAPVVTVKDGQGNVVYQGPVAFLPQDSNLTSVGVVKVPDAKAKNGTKDQFGFTGIFTPTFALNNTQGPHSSFPALDYPALILTAYHGDLGLDSGIAQNVYQLDTTHMKQFKDAKGNIVSKAMKPGETLTLPNGAGSLTFEGVKTWASFQISHQAATGWALASVVTMILGLIGSLFIQRRRVWIRTTVGRDGVTVVELAGLGRSESARIADELGDLVDVLASQTAPPVAEPEPAAESEPDLGQAKPEQAKPEQAKPEQAEPEQAEPEQANPEQANPEQAQPESDDEGARA